MPAPAHLKKFVMLGRREPNLEPHSASAAMDNIHLFLDIPQDVIGLILLQLEVTSTVLVALTCRALQKATKDIWRHQTLRITDFNTLLVREFFFW
jgi:hypothetical protein